MQVQWYRDSTELENQTYNVDSAIYFCDTQVEAYNKIVITIGNMNKPNRFLKIFNIADGVTRQFYNDELENVEIIEAITNNNQALNINEADLVILPKNTTGVQFQRTLPFSIYRNDVLFGRFFIDTSTSNSYKTLYSLAVKDYINTLDKQTFLGGKYTGKTVSSLVAEILGDIPYQLDATLGNYTVTGYLPILSKREALRQLAFCLNAYIDTSRQDKVVIKPFSNARNRFVDLGEILDIETTQQNIVTKIQVEFENIDNKPQDAEELYNQTLDGTEMIVFDSPKYNLSITGGTIVSSNINYAIIEGAGSNVTLTGKTYETYSKLYEKTNEYTVSTDIDNIQQYHTTLKCNQINILDKLKFVEYTVKSHYKMDNTKVGDLVVIDGMTCRVSQLNYDLKQTEIYAEAQMEKYYYDATELYLTSEAGDDLITENNIILEAEGQ